MTNDDSAPGAALGPAPSRPWWRLHKSTMAIGALAVALAAVWNVSGIMRHKPPGLLFEWRYGWPLTYLHRDVGFNPDRSPYKPWAMNEQVREFHGLALAGNVLFVAFLAAVLAAGVERRRRRKSGRPFQITLRQVAWSFVVLSAVLGWSVSVLKAHRREEAAVVELLTAGDAGVCIEHGLPHWLRSWFAAENPLFRMENFQGDFLPFDRVRAVALAGLQIVDDELAPLAELPDVAWLELWPTSNLSDDGFRHIRGLRQLEYLNCSGAALLTDEAVSHLADLTELRELHMLGAGVTGEGVQRLRRLTKLEHLDLTRSEVDDAGILALQTPHMRILFLSETQVGDGCLEHIAGMRKLELLTLYGTDVTDAGLRRLHGHPTLQYLDVRASSVTPAGLAALREASPSLQIRRD